MTQGLYINAKPDGNAVQSLGILFSTVDRFWVITCTNPMLLVEFRDSQISNTLIQKEIPFWLQLDSMSPWIARERPYYISVLTERQLLNGLFAHRGQFGAST
jgi:hypothetical protein